MSSLFTLSETETDLSGLRIARATTIPPDLSELKASLVAERIDVLKLYLSPAPPSLLVKLNQLGVPHHLVGQCLRYKLTFTGNPPVSMPATWRFVLATKTDEILLRQFLSKNSGAVQASYFQNPALEPLPTHGQSLAHYALSFAPWQHADRYIHCVFEGHKLLAVSCSRRYHTGGEVALAAAIPSRGGSALAVLISHLAAFGKAIGQQWGTCDVQLQNTAAHKAMARLGLVPVGHAVSVHVNCFFNREPLQRP